LTSSPNFEFKFKDQLGERSAFEEFYRKGYIYIDNSVNINVLIMQLFIPTNETYPVSDSSEF